MIDLPTSNNFVRAVNALYSSRDQEYPTNEEIIQLPQIQRDQITLTKFLGSGAFGEVYEGTVKNILYENVETKVALKVKAFSRLITVNCIFIYFLSNYREEPRFFVVYIKIDVTLRRCVNKHV